MHGRPGLPISHTIQGSADRDLLVYSKPVQVHQCARALCQPEALLEGVCPQVHQAERPFGHSGQVADTHGGQRRDPRADYEDTSTTVHGREKL